MTSFMVNWQLEMLGIFYTKRNECVTNLHISLSLHLLVSPSSSPSGKFGWTWRLECAELSNLPRLTWYKWLCFGDSREASPVPHLIPSRAASVVPVPASTPSQHRCSVFGSEVGSGRWFLLILLLGVISRVWCRLGPAFCSTWFHGWHFRWLLDWRSGYWCWWVDWWWTVRNLLHRSLLLILHFSLLTFTEVTVIVLRRNRGKSASSPFVITHVQWTRAEEEAAEKVKRRIERKTKNDINSGTHTDVAVDLNIEALCSANFDDCDTPSTQRALAGQKRIGNDTLKVKSRSARANENENIRHPEVFSCLGPLGKIRTQTLWTRNPFLCKQDCSVGDNVEAVTSL